MNNQNIETFLDNGLTAHTEKHTEELAQKYNKSYNYIDMIVIDCVENIALNPYMGNEFYNEYEGDSKEFGEWFVSYVEDCVYETITAEEQ